MSPKKTQSAKGIAQRIFEFTDDEAIHYSTSRKNVISVMNRIHRDRIDMKIVLEQLGKTDFMVLSYPTDHSTYDENMEVELKMENSVSIDKLVKNVGQVLKGKFLLCRTITPSSKMNGVDAAVEDVEGKKAMRLSLFNYSVEAKMGKSDFEAVLPLGTMLIVKNPVFKKPTSLTPIFGLIVENPADVELLSPKKMEKLFPSVHWKSDLPQESRALFASPLLWEFPPDQSDLEIATKLKLVGNKAFVENRATDAIRFYDVALEYLPVMEEVEMITPASSALLIDILSNKAAALIKLECFNPALVYTGKVLGSNTAHVKSIYRHAKALIGLGRYSEGGEFLDEKIKQLGGEENKDILRLRSIVAELGKPPRRDVVIALRNPRRTKYNQPKLDLPAGMLDRIYEFVGAIEFGNAKSEIGECQGAFATQDLEPGTILLVSKPFAGLYVRPEEKKTFLLNTSTHEHLVGLMANKIRLDPDLGRDLYKLWAGPDLKFLTDKEDPVKKVDIARIRNICHFNTRGYKDDDTFISCGVYIPSSKINHSCIDANVMYHHHDVSLIMMVTTFKKVKKGEEILMSFVNPLKPSGGRNTMESTGFICKCRLCELERSENPDVIARREEILQDLVACSIPIFYPCHSQMVAEDLAAIAELESLHTGTPDLNLALANSRIHALVAVVLVDLGHYSVCLPIMEKIYAVLENIATSHKHPALLASILVCCMNMGKEKAVLERWAEELRKHCRLYAGSLEYVREGDHPTIPEELKKFGIEYFTDTD
ncbi:uncharacterized protein LOC110843117 [Folsomia candida]|uniref:SET and MYND domain-containing protein 5 n=1 Tax=Folsomia candida TaxID=158441 RepID=A0A226F4W6_FOLCA|nr:uncharacterized protein LOC110843117 [Folsomia candida]OXA64464.1 SET and MYND domain-containing protein 5 [Folsomia candida]